MTALRVALSRQALAALGACALAVAIGLSVPAVRFDAWMVAAPALVLGLVSFWHFTLRRVWPAAVASLWSMSVITAWISRSPYRSGALPRGAIYAAIAASVFLIAWATARHRPRVAAPRTVVRAAASSAPAVKVVAIAMALAVCGLVGTLLKFRTSGVPLFSESIDATRGAAREGASIVSGSLNEAWTVGSWLTLSAALGHPLLERARRFCTVAFPFFLLGASLGGSRNAIIYAVAPAGLAYVVWSPKARTRPRPGRVLGLSLVTLAVAGALFMFAGARVLGGVGAFERDVQSRSGGSPLQAGLIMADVSFTAPLETLGRLLDAEESGPPSEGWGRYSTQSINILYKPVDDGRQLYDVTGPLGAPYYMNVATFVGAPLADFGPAGGVIAAGALGLVTAVLENALTRRHSLLAALSLGMLVYFAMFSIYEALPLLYLTPFIDVLYLMLATRFLRTADARVGAAP